MSGKADAKRKTKREKQKYANLDPQVNLLSRAEEIGDFDYLDKLNEEELDFLNKFAGEYINASVPKFGGLHRTKEEKSEVYGRNNARNRDLYSRSKAGAKLVYMEDLPVELRAQAEQLELQALDKVFHPTRNLQKRKGKRRKRRNTPEDL